VSYSDGLATDMKKFNLIFWLKLKPFCPTRGVASSIASMASDADPARCLPIADKISVDVRRSDGSLFGKEVFGKEVSTMRMGMKDTPDSRNYRANESNF
jgi:hypothetical protein